MARRPKPRYNAKSAAAEEAEDSSRRPNTSMIIVGCSMAALAVVQLPTAVLLMIAGLPYLVANMVDTSPRRGLIKKVFLLDAAATLPYLLRLWGGRNDWDAAAAILGTPSIWLVIYSAAGFAWVLHRILPAITGGITRIFLEGRLAKHEQRLKELETVWGEEVGKF